MNNQLTVSQRADALVSAVLADKTGALERTLPKHVKADRFRRNLATAVIQHPKLLGCDPAAVFNEVSKAAALGLLLDPQLGEAYLITQWSKDGDTPRLMIGYRGLIKLARQSGDISTIYAHEICDLDRFHVSLGSDKKLIHEPNYLAPRGNVCMYYAVVHFKDGTTDFEPMSLRDIHAIRDRSDGWRAFKAGKIKSTPWGTDEGEMAKKTALRRLLKRCPQSPELVEALANEDQDYIDAEVTVVHAPTPKIQRTKPPEKPAEDHQAISATEVAGEFEDSRGGAPQPEDGTSPEVIETVAGEVSDYADTVELEIDTATVAIDLHKWFNGQLKTAEWDVFKTADPGRAADVKAKALAQIAELKPKAA